MAEKATEKKDRKPTPRTVLTEIEVPREALNEALGEEIAKLVPGFMTDTAVVAYVVVGEGAGSQVAAIEGVVGKAEGTFKAVPTSSWHDAISQGEETIPEQKKFRRRRVRA